ncbi:MAG TPA: HEPN domain-containing protein [Chloroflexota bacterium]|nr:HEPN domain-containing protein [Chloroflexota bacterium]
MQHRSPAGTPEEWLRRARSNLLRAQQPRPEGVYWEDLCFDAQQAAEKAIKALLCFSWHSLPLCSRHCRTDNFA